MPVGRRRGRKRREGESLVDLLVTRMAHFGLAYMRLFARSSTTKRSHPNEERRAVGGKGLAALRAGLQDEINTILCKRAGLIALGKASGISGIPNKLTLNVEGSANRRLPSPLAFPRRECKQPGRSSYEHVSLRATGNGERRKYISMLSRATRSYPNIT